jgi:hypothetical protein
MMTSGISAGSSEQSCNMVESIGFICLTCLCVAAGIAFVAGSIGASARRAVFEIDDTINPNDASPASLARLPRIGPARAREIASYRNQFSGQTDRMPVFRDAGDLRKVTGIGPATVEAMRPWLSFSSNAPDDSDVPGRRP